MWPFPIDALEKVWRGWEYVGHMHPMKAESDSPGVDNRYGRRMSNGNWFAGHTVR